MGFKPVVSIEDELNPWLAQEARFDYAAKKLNLDDGIWKVLRHPTRELIVHIPVQMDDGRIEVFTGYRVQHSHLARPRQGRRSLCPGCHARRGTRSGQLDDLEVRRRQYPLRRSQGRQSSATRTRCRRANWSA